MTKWIVIFLFALGSLTASAKISSPTSSSSSEAELSELSLGIERSLYADVFIFSGYTQFSHPQITDTISGGYSGLGLTLGFRLSSSFLMGISADYRYMSQITSVDSEHLNLTSTRFVPFAPTLGFKFESYLVKLDYQFAGTVDVAKSLSDGSNLRFEKPEGFRLIFIFSKWFGFAPVGLYYEQVRFSQQTISNLGSSQLSHDINTWQIGGIINVLL